MAELDEGFSFGDFVFSTPQPQPHPHPQPQPQPINGGLTSADDDWGDFFVAPSQTQPQPSFSSGFSLPFQSKPDNPKPSINSDPLPANSTRPVSASKPRGALPLSLFGEVEDEEEEKKPDSIDSGNKNNSNGVLDPNSNARNVKVEVNLVSKGSGFNNSSDIFANLYPPTQHMKPNIGSGLNSGVSAPDLNNLSDGGDDDVDEVDDDWEFMGAFPENGSQEKGASASPESKAEPRTVTNQEKQAGQDASSSVEYKRGSSSTFPQFVDLFAGHHGAIHKSNEMDVGLNNGAKTVHTNGFVSDLFHGFQATGSGSGISGSSVNTNDDIFAPRKSAEKDVGSNSRSIVINANGFMPDLFHGVEVTDGSGIGVSSVNEGDDLFAPHKSNDMGVGLNCSFAANTNGLMPDLFDGVQSIGNGNGISAASVNGDDDFDDFGDFVDASQEIGPQKEHCSSGSKAQLPNGNIQDQETQLENSRGPLPQSLFSDDLEASSDGLAHQGEMFDKPISKPSKGFSSQGPGISIHDLLQNLYIQAPQTSIVDSKSIGENGVQSPQKADDSTLLGDDDDDDWDDNSWDFKNASLETEMKEQSSAATPEIFPQNPSEAASNLPFYLDFYAKLEKSLCVLLSHQLNKEKKSPTSETIGHDGKAEAFSHDIEEAHKLLECSRITKEFISKQLPDRSHLLNEVLEALQGPKCKVIESEYSLSERLQLATNDWRVATELLRHTLSIQRMLSLGSPDDQSIYVSSWAKIIGVCLQELTHGTLIWRRALEKDVQSQLLDDSRGQRYIQALGEIYKAVELLRLSTKFYKPWMLLSLSDPPQQLFRHLEECASLWSSSGLEEALQNLSDNVGLGHNEAAKALITSIKSIREVDLLAVYDSVFVQRQSICQLSLLPLEILSDLKVALWNTEPYFVNLANLWANRISPYPPQLPRLQVSQSGLKSPEFQAIR